MTVKRVTVTVRAGAVVYDGDVAHGPGTELTLSATDAKTLAEQGVVVEDDAPAKRGG